MYKLSEQWEHISWPWLWEWFLMMVSSIWFYIEGAGGGGGVSTITPPPSIAIFFPLYRELSGPHSVTRSNQEYSAIPCKKFVLYKKTRPTQIILRKFSLKLVLLNVSKVSGVKPCANLLKFSNENQQKIRMFQPNWEGQRKWKTLAKK